MPNFPNDPCSVDCLSFSPVGKRLIGQMLFLATHLIEMKRCQIARVFEVSSFRTNQRAATPYLPYPDMTQRGCAITKGCSFGEVFAGKQIWRFYAGAMGSF